MWQIKQKMQGRRLSFLGYLNKNICSSQLLLQTLSSGLILTSPVIVGLSSILVWVLHWPLLCLSWSLFSRLPWSDLYWSTGAAHCLYELKVGSRRFWGTPMHNDIIRILLQKWVLPLCRYAIGVFYSPSWLGPHCNKFGRPEQCTIGTDGEREPGNEDDDDYTCVYIKHMYRHSWCNAYPYRKWTRRLQLKSETRLFELRIALITLGKVCIYLFSSGADWAL